VHAITRLYGPFQPPLDAWLTCLTALQLRLCVCSRLCSGGFLFGPACNQAAQAAHRYACACTFPSPLPGCASCSPLCLRLHVSFSLARLRKDPLDPIDNAGKVELLFKRMTNPEVCKVPPMISGICAYDHEPPEIAEDCAPVAMSLQ